ncbi:MAG: zinc-dependent alcohol dehydrogenase family protein [Gammaproteobacteria bacterium]|nr:zinc-dependent alcohol dehydrogenase family protein [Gammaproteobacteria bacterium]
MQAMALHGIGEPLRATELPIPTANNHQLLLRVLTCGVCRTDLHVVDGELPSPCLPIIPGHQIVGEVIRQGTALTHVFKPGSYVGVPWLGGTCGHCNACQHNQENLCDQAMYTGYQINGGFAEYCVADGRYCFPIPAGYSPLQAAPLLCAGLIGYRAFKKVGAAKHIGFYGFGSAAHILTQLSIYLGRSVYAFTRPDDNALQTFAKSLGAVWAGGSDQEPPQQLDAAIIFAADGNLLPKALQDIRKGGAVICAGIHMSDIPSFPYAYLWGERRVESVANLTRQDGEEFLALAPKVPIETKVNVYPLLQANQALEDLRFGRFDGSAVIDVRNIQHK